MELVEIWSPDFSQHATKGTVMQNQTACTSLPISNYWIFQNENNLENNTNSSAYIALQNCLLASNANAIGGLPSLQTFQQCGTGIPYWQCIQIFSLPSTAQGAQLSYAPVPLIILKIILLFLSSILVFWLTRLAIRYLLWKN